MRAVALLSALVLLILGACGEDDTELRMWASTVCPELAAMDAVYPYTGAFLTPAANRRFVEERAPLYIAAAESAVAAFDRIVPPAGAVALHAYLREFAAGAVDAARELGAVAARGSDFELASGSRAFDADIDRLSHTLFTEELRDEEEAVNIYIKRCTSG